MTNRRRERREAQRLNAAKTDKKQPDKGVKGDGPVSPVTPASQIREAWAEVCRLMEAMKPSYVQFARRLADGADQGQAAIDAGYSVSNARSQGCKMAADEQVIELVKWLQRHSVLTEAHISKPALRQVIIEIMNSTEASAADRVAAVRAGSKLEGFDRLKVEVTGGTPAVDGDALRKELADRLARQMSKAET